MNGEPDGGAPWLVVVTGWTGAGKSTIADLIAGEAGATVASFDWVMSGLRAIPAVWTAVDGVGENLALVRRFMAMGTSA
jgi:predicted kinase